MSSSPCLATSFLLCGTRVSRAHRQSLTHRAAIDIAFNTTVLSALAKYVSDGRDRIRNENIRSILFCRDPRGWSMPSGRPHASWLRKVVSYLKDADIAGLASAWAMARRRPKEYRRKVDAATRCSGVCPHT